MSIVSIKISFETIERFAVTDAESPVVEYAEVVSSNILNIDIFCSLSIAAIMPVMTRIYVNDITEIAIALFTTF